MAPFAGSPGDLSAAVTRHLRDFLARRSLDAAGLDARFADEVIDRLTSFVLDGGKRMRPTFAWWGWRAAGGAPEGPAATATLRAASALELVQTFALVQDDVMDGSALRRGRPTLHMEFADEHRSAAWSGESGRYGASMAVLAADLALVWAEEMFTDALDGLPDARERARVPWRAMHTEMVVGQFMDLRSQASGEETESLPLRIGRLKTAAYSVERPLHLGAAIAGASEEVVSGLRRYGAAVGCAYQLRDDLLDLYGDPDRTGKPIGGDLREGKRTLLLVLGLRTARERADAETVRTLRSAVGDPGLTETDVRAIAGILADLGAKDAVERRLGDLVDEATRCLAATPVAPVACRELQRLAHDTVTRTY
ncbi:polyprenyl synthetase family protein [Marinactinospora rubrisoli]|uniref:Polyprenyl synthetase family protein n=1 Tax=Marinactinospora rubrisoli TaxID=2715399 RepID=A0ABW2KDP0_9ACTN